MKRLLTTIFVAIATLEAPPVVAEPLSHSNHLDTSASILTDVLYTVDDDLIGILRYPLDNPETTGLFLLGIGAQVVADRPFTIFYQDTIEPTVEGNPPICGVDGFNRSLPKNPKARKHYLTFAKTLTRH